MDECNEEWRNIEGKIGFCVPHHKLMYECEIVRLQADLKAAQESMMEYAKKYGLALARATETEKCVWGEAADYCADLSFNGEPFYKKAIYEIAVEFRRRVGGKV